MADHADQNRPPPVEALLWLVWRLAHRTGNTFRRIRRRIERYRRSDQLTRRAVVAVCVLTSALVALLIAAAVAVL